MCLCVKIDFVLWHSTTNLKRLCHNWGKALGYKRENLKFIRISRFTLVGSIASGLLCPSGNYSSKGRLLMKSSVF
jgi:hypothetical protein